MTPLGCTVTPLEPARVEAILRAVADGSQALKEVQDLRWLLATCHDGVVWGLLEEGSLALSPALFPEISPTPERATLLELRLFGPDSEIRLWRTEDGFEGCRIESTEESALAGTPTAPKRESWLLVGNRFKELRDGFTLVSGDGGKRQAVPLEIDASRAEQDLPLRLEVCHHLEQDEENGAVRVALTRFTGLVPGSRGDAR